MYRLIPIYRVKIISQKITEIKRRNGMNGNKNCTELSIFKRIVGILLFGLAAILGNVISAIPCAASIPMAIAYFGIQCRLWF